MTTDQKTQGDHATKLFEGKKEKGILGYNKEESLKTMKIIIWSLLTIWISFTPIMMRYSFYTKDGIHKHKYIPSTVHFIGFFTSIFLGQAISYFQYGKKGLMDCFDWRTILLLVPASCGYSFSEFLALTALSSVPAMWYAVIHKMRLLLTCIMSVVFLKRKVSPLQWIQCCIVTTFVLAFCLLGINKSESKNENYIFGCLLLILNITVSVGCSIYADWAYKKLTVPLPVQISCGRISASFTSFLISARAIYARGQWSKYGFFGGPGGGWDLRVLGFLLWNIFRDWLTCANLLYLTALWKAIAAVVAIIVTYVFDIIINRSPVQPIQAMIILGIFLSVFAYTLIKKLEGEKEQSRKREIELQKQLSIYQSSADSLKA